MEVEGLNNKEKRGPWWTWQGKHAPWWRRKKPKPLDAPVPPTLPSSQRLQLTELVGLNGRPEPAPTHLASVVADARRNARFVVEVRVVRVRPQETRNCTRPFCSLCKSVLDVVDDADLVCPACGSVGVEFRYVLALKVTNGHVPLTVLLVGDEGALFFRSLPPCDLWRNHETHRLLAQKLDVLVNSRATVKLGVQSYTVEDKKMYQVFNTILVV